MHNPYCYPGTNCKIPPHTPDWFQNHFCPVEKHDTMDLGEGGGMAAQSTSRGGTIRYKGGNVSQAINSQQCCICRGGICGHTQPCQFCEKHGSPGGAGGPAIPETVRIGTVVYPHRCPVCYGNGLVPPGFYAQGNMGGSWSAAGASPISCKSCNGSGIVWG